MKFVKLLPGGMFAIETLAITLAYSALAWAGQLVAIEPGNVTAVWPASGLALVIAMWRGRRAVLGLWLGVVLGSTWPFLDPSTLASAIRTTAIGIAIGPGAICQAFLGSYLARRWCSAGELFGRIRDVFAFVFAQAIACLISATGGVLALSLGGLVDWSSYGYTWLTWYLGDGAGIILFAPLLLTARSVLPILRDVKRLAEVTAILLLSAVVSGLVFGDVLQPSLSFLPLPFVLWAAVRGNRFAVSATVLVIYTVAVGFISLGRGPFAAEDTNIFLLVLQLYAATTVVTGLAVASALSELRRTDARLLQALTSGNVGLWDWDIAAGTVYFSDQLKVQLGYGPDEPWDGGYEEWEGRLHPEDKPTAVQCVTDYLQGKLPNYISTFRLRRKDGTYAWILSRGGAEWDERNEPRRIIGVHVDVSEGKRRAAELERTNLELKQMTYAASHDLQEPLRAISSFSQLVDRRYRELLDDDGRDWLDAIVRSAKRMQTLIHDLRSYTELDSPSHAFELTGLQRVLADALDNLHNSISECRAEVTCDPLPVIMGNASQLVQLFQNLVGNAIKYRSELTPVVHVSAERRDRDWLISVRDNGIGIDAAQHDAIFEVFRRLHHRQEQPGTGIGLAVCRRVVERHGGQIWIESALGKGSTFRFTIPVAEDEVKT